MKTMQGGLTKRVLVGLMAGGTIMAATAYAMPDTVGGNKPRCEQRSEQIQARIEQRKQYMAELKEKLKLTPAQEAAWDKFSASAKPAQRHAGMDRQAMREEFQKLNTIERLEKIQAMKEVRHASMTERFESLKEFYKQLTPKQQKVFDAEVKSRHHERMQHRHRSQS